MRALECYKEMMANPMTRKVMKLLRDAAKKQVDDYMVKAESLIRENWDGPNADEILERIRIEFQKILAEELLRYESVVATACRRAEEG